MIFKFSSDNEDNVINLGILRLFYLFSTIIFKSFGYLFYYFSIFFRVKYSFVSFQFYIVIFSG